MEFIQNFKNYLISQKHASSKVTVKNYLADVRHFISWCENNLQAQFSPTIITPKTIEDFKKNKLQELSASSVERHISSIRKFFTFLKLEGVISNSPFDNTPQPKVPMDAYRLKAFKDFLYVYNASHLTIKNYLIDIKQFIAWAEEVTDIKENWQVSEQNLLSKIDDALLQAYRDRLYNGNIFSASSINRKLSSLRKYLSWAASQGMLAKQLHFPQAGTEAKQAQIIPELIPSPTTSDEKKEVTKAYSKIPPVRLAQKIAKGLDFLFEYSLIFPIAKAAEGINHTVWKLKGKKVFDTSARIITEAEKLPSIANITKELYAPLGVSTANFSLRKKLLHRFQYTRPEWYKRYRNTTVSSYFNLAVLLIFASALGVGLYVGFVQKPHQQSPAFAALPTAPPRILSFQGRLTDVSDNPISANTNLRFAIYSDITATGSALLWQEVDNVTPDADGVFSALLGKNSSIPSSLFTQNASLYLGVTVGQTAELTPRQQLATVAYATNAETLQGLPPITQSGAGTQNVVLALDSGGNLSIGAATTFQSTTGQFTLAGNSLLLNTNAGSNGNIAFAPDGSGIIDLQKPLQNTTNNNNIPSALGAVEVDDLLAILATSSGQSAFTINQNGGGPIISASAGGSARFTVDNGGNVAANTYFTGLNNSYYINSTVSHLNSLSLDNTFSVTGGVSSNLVPTATDTYDLGSPANEWNNLYVRQIISPSSGGIVGFWQLNSSVLSPANIWNDLAVGGTATNTAAFQIYGSGANKGTATTSGNIIFTGTNPFLASLNGQAFSINTSAGGGNGSAKFIVNNDGTIRMTSYGTGLLHSDASGNLTSSAVNLAGSDVTGLLSTADGGLGSNVTAATGGEILYSTSATTYGHLAAGSIGLCLTSNGTGAPAWASCTGSGNTNNWVLDAVNGTLYPTISTLDVLAGGTSTASAKFAVLHMTGLATPVASVSAQNALGQAIYLDSAGSIQTTRNNQLTIGGNTTGNIVLNPLNGTGSLTLNGSQTTTGNQTINGNTILGTNNTNTVTINGLVNSSIIPAAADTYDLGSPANEWNNIYVKNIIATGTTAGFWQLNSGALSPANSSNDLLIGGTSTASGKFHIFADTGNASTAGNLTFDNTGSIQTTRFQDLTLGGTTTGNIILNPKDSTGTVTLSGYASGIIRSTNGVLSSSSVNLNSSDVTGALPVGNGGTGLNSISNGTLVYGSGGSTLNTLASGTGNSVLVSNGTNPIWATALTLTDLTVNGNTTLGASGTDTITINAHLNSDLIPATNGTLNLGDSTHFFNNIYANNIIAPTSGGTSGYWTLSNNILYPVNNSFDLAVGGTATGSATPFQVFSLNNGVAPAGTATTSGNLVFRGSASNTTPEIDILDGRNLTVKTSPGGNVGLTTVLALNSNGDISQTGNFTTSGNLAVNGGNLTTSASIFNLLNANATTIHFGEGANVISIGAGSGTTTINNALTTTGLFTANNNVILGQNSANNITVNGQFNSSLVPNTPNAFDLGSSTNEWNNIYVKNIISSGVIAGFWQTNTGVLSPANIADDVAVGGTSTASAKFHIFGLTGNATTTGTLTFDTAGNIQTTRFQDLTIGGNTTGNIILTPKNGTGTITFTGYGQGIIHSSGTGLLSSSAVNLNTDVSGILPLVSGGTGADLSSSASTNQGGVVYSGGTFLGVSTPGTLGQCLVSNGSSAPTFGSCATNNYWAQQNGALYPLNGTVDLLVGASATTAAKFAVLNIASANTTVASVSAQNALGQAVYIDSAGSIQTTRNNQLTIGGNTTGNILLSPLNGNGSVTINSNAVLGATSANTLTFNADVNSNIIPLLTNTYDLGSATNQWNNIYANNIFQNGQPITQVWQRNLGVISPLNIADDVAVGGTSTSSATLQIFGKNYVTDAGTVTSGTATTSGNFVFRGTNPTINVLNNQSLTFKVSAGGDVGLHTAFTIGADGNITAANNLAVNGGSITTTQITGNLFTTNATTVNIGSIATAVGIGASTGTTTIGNELIVNNGLLNTALLAKVPNGTSAIGVEVANPTIDASHIAYVLANKQSNNTDMWQYATDGTNFWNYVKLLWSNKTLSLAPDGDTTVGIGTTNTLATLDVRSLLGTSPIASFSGKTSFAGLVINNNGIGDLFTASASSTSRFTIANDGSIKNSIIPYLNNTYDLGEINRQWNNIYGNNIYSNGQLVSPSWQRNVNVLSPLNIGDDVAVGGTSTSSATYQIYGTAYRNDAGTVTSGTATTSGNLVFRGTNPTIAALNNQSLTFKVSAGGDIGLHTAFTIGADGNITAANNIMVNGTTLSFGNASTSTIQTTGINAGLTLLSNGAGNITFGQNVGNGNVVIQPNAGGQAGLIINDQGLGDIFTASAAGTTELTLTRAGQLQSRSFYDLDNLNYFLDPAATGTSLNVAGTASTAADLTFFDASGTNPGINILNGNRLDFKTSVGGNTGLTTAFSVLNNGRIGINTINALATLDTHGNNGTTAIASVSGSTAFAGLVVDNANNGDIFTASSSGLTRFVINTNGVITASNYTTGIAHFNTNGLLSSSAVNLAGGSSEITGFLPTANGGLGANITAAGGGELLYSTSATTYGHLAAGGSGKCLFSNGTGAPNWGTCITSTGSSYWNLVNGALFPVNTTVDLLVGGSATTSAKFAVLNLSPGLSATPVASISAQNAAGQAVFIDSAGSIQTTRNNALTIGGNSTGNIILKPLNGTGNGNVSIAGLTTGIVHSDANGKLTSSPVDLTLTSEVTNKLGVDNGGTGLNSAVITNGSLLYGSGGNPLNVLAIGATNTILTSDGTKPQWSSNLTVPGDLSVNGNTTIGDASSDTVTFNASLNSNITPATNGTLNLGDSTHFFNNIYANNLIGPTSAGTSGFWTLSNNVLYPVNSSFDLAVGGTGTGSATPFQVFATTISPAVAGTATTSGNLVFRGSASNTTPEIDILDGRNLTVKTSPGGNVGLTTVLALNSNGDISQTGNFTTSGNLAVNGGNLTTSQTSFNLLNTNATNIVFGSGATSSISIGNNIGVNQLFGNWAIGGSSANTINLIGKVNSSIIPNADLSYDIGGTTNRWRNIYAGNLLLPSTGGIGGYWQLNSLGVLAPTNSSNDLAVGSTATGSATVFQIFANAYVNNFGTVPAGTATTSGNLTFRGTPGNQTAFRQNLLNGSTLGIYTSVGGDFGTSTNPALYVANTNFVGVGTSTPQANLDISGNTSGGIFENITNLNTAGTTLLNFPETNSGFPFFIKRYGSTNATPNLVDIWNAQTTGDIRFGVGNQERVRFLSNGNVGINTTSPLAILDLRGTGSSVLSGTIPVASISGKTSYAALVVNNDGNGDIFTASSSGIPRFTIANDGTLKNSLIPNITDTYNLGSDPNLGGREWDTLYVRQIITPTGGGIAGFWQLSNKGVLTPANPTNDLAIGNNATGSATPFQIFATSYANDAGIVPAGTATTSGNLTFRGTPTSQTNFKVNLLNGSNLGFYTSAGGNLGLATTPSLSVANNGFVGIGTNAPQRLLQVGSNSNPNISSAVKILATDATDARLGAAVSDHGAFLGAGDGSTYGAVYAYNYAGGAAENLILNQFGGNVGIGTTNPQGLLHIVDSSNNDDLIANQTAATNLITNPSFETTIGNWTQQQGGSGGAWAQSEAQSYFGDSSLLITTGTGFTSAYQTITVTPSTTYTFSAWVKTSTTSNAKLVIFDTGTSANTSSSYHTGNGQWQRLSVTTTTGSSTTSIQAKAENDIASTITYYDGMQLEQASSASPYLDGSLGSGYYWTGAPNASTSVRTLGATFAYQTLNSAAGIGAASRGQFPTLQLDQDGTGDIIAASASGATEFRLLNTGTVQFRSLQDLDNTQYFIDLAASNTSINIAGTASLSGNIIFNGGGSQKVDLFNNASLGFYTSVGGVENANPALFIANSGHSGYVGLATTNPTSPLQINYDSTTVPGILLGGGSNVQNFISISGGRTMFGYDGNNTLIDSGSGHGIGFYVNGNGTSFPNGIEAMFIKSSSEVAIGTTSPLANSGLDIEKNALGNAALVINQSGNGDIIGASASGTSLFRVTNAGTVLANQGLPQVCSTGNGGYSFIGEGCFDTGMFSSSDNDLEFWNNNVDRFNVTTAGADISAGDFYIHGHDVQSFSGTDTSIFYSPNFWKWQTGSGGTVQMSLTNGGNLRVKGSVTPNTTPDIAEGLPVLDSSINAGDILAPDPGAATVSGKKTTEAYQNNMLGVVSTNPSILLASGIDVNSNSEALIADNLRALVLAGRVPTKVTSANGTIAVGDTVTTSSLGGFGEKATKAGTSVGVALEPFNPTDATCPTISSINAIVWPADSGANEFKPCYKLPDGTYVGKIMMFVKVNWYDPQIYLTDTGNVNIIDTQPSSDIMIPHYFSLNDALGNPISRVEELSQAAIANVTAGIISTQQLFTNSLAIATDNVTIAGQSLKDYIIAVVTNAHLGGNNQIAQSDTVKTNVISPLATSSAITIDLSNSRIDIKKNASSAAVASIDNNGNATFSGSLNSENLAVNTDATISGTLHAGKIVADDIEGLNAKLGTLSAQNITNVTNIYFATASGSQDGQNQTTGSNSSSNNNAGVPTSGSSGYTNIASFSGEFAYVPNLKATTGLFTDGLASMGPTSLTDTTITGQLSIGSQLILADNSINVLSGDLQIQPLRQGGIAFAGGTIRIDTDGNLNVNGNAYFNGNLAANIISPLSNDKDLTLQLGNNASSSALAKSNLAVKNASGSAIFNIDQLGNLVASGAATIAKLNFSLVQPAQALSNTEIVATGSAGTAAITPYQTEVTIDNVNVTANSLIYITPVGNDSGQIPYLRRQVSGTSFTVGIPAMSTIPTYFNWLIVN